MCSELGIECHYVQGFKKDGIEGHSWNIVKLDNKYYNVDLTWDRNYIINNQRPKFFLKSDADFDHESYSEALTVTNICCEGSLDTKEQALLYDSLNLNMKQIFGRQINKIGAIVERYIAKNKDIVACSYDKQVIEHKQNSMDVLAESIPYFETKNYIKKVYTAYWNYLLTYEKVKI